MVDSASFEFVSNKYFKIYKVVHLNITNWFIYPYYLTYQLYLKLVANKDITHNKGA